MGEELIDSSVSKAYRCAKVGLNAGTLRKLGRENTDMLFSDRMLKCMGNETLYMTPPISNLDEWFLDGDDLVVYQSIPDLVRELRRLIEDETERHRIAHNGYSKVVESHTVDIRIEQYLAIIEGRSCPFNCHHPPTTS